MLAFSLLLSAHARATGISGLSLSSSCFSSGDTITINFTALINQWQSGSYAIAISTDTTPSSGDTWYSSSMNGSCPGNGFGTGGGGGGNPQSLPQTRNQAITAANGSYYLIVIVKSNGWIGDCTGEANAYLPITIGPCGSATATPTATPVYSPTNTPLPTATRTPLVPSSCGTAAKLDLEVWSDDAAGCVSDNEFNLRYRIYNHEASTYAVSNLKIRVYVNNSNGAGWTSSAEWYANYTAGGSWSNNNSSSISAGTSLGACGSGSRLADTYYDITFNGANLIPASGGYLEGYSRFRRGGDPTPFDFNCDDYSQPIGATRADSPYYTLHLTGSGDCVVCEYDNASTQDAETGVEPCSGVAGCVFLSPTPTPTYSFSPTQTPYYSPTHTPFLSQTPTWTFTRTITRTWTQSYTVSPTPTRTQTPNWTHTISPTPAPASPTHTLTPIAIPMSKTINVASATIGDTITYCITWQNNTGGSTTVVIWDTLPMAMTYLGANNSGTYAPRLVTWNLGSQANGASGSVCFWAVIAGYPWLPGADAATNLAYRGAREEDVIPWLPAFYLIGARP